MTRRPSTTPGGSIWERPDIKRGAALHACRTRPADFTHYATDPDRWSKAESEPSVILDGLCGFRGPRRSDIADLPICLVCVEALDRRRTV